MVVLNRPSQSLGLTCTTCKDSSTVVVDHVEGNQLCLNCGRVLENVLISEQQEWRNFNTESLGQAGAEKSRVGELNDVWLDGTSSTTFIGGSKKMQHLQNLMTNYDSSDRALKTSFTLLRTIADSLNMRDQVVERSKEILKELNQMGHLRSRSNSLNTLAVLYLACRESSVSRSLRELVIYDRSLTVKELGRAINRLKKVLPNRGNAPTEDVSQLMPRFCSRLNLSNEFMTTCEAIAQKSFVLLTSAHRTTSLAGGIIYLVTRLFFADDSPISISDISQVCGTSTGTIKTTFKELCLYLDKLIPPKHRDKMHNITNIPNTSGKVESSQPGVRSLLTGNFTNF
ncbi:transcription initiation factor tfiib, putative [Theileria annulata]|uniref:General transcription factor TFIIB n=1 Tax=Theileria annulata TaxID=5874 RepID=Q4UDQ3_THEAN|nr:transcription initiation factor tfiib, putative [Theileria annulata]CAI74786.1 transcription initiation factor tfiib, putative [Theileria annulata]|eukprot:XP_952518.1 transcription initiation factor tfiib, putative [Theileria annulata]